MAIEIIDLTSSPPPHADANSFNAAVAATTDPAETDRKKRKRKSRREAAEQRGRWQHDKYLDEDVNDRGQKRKWDKGDNESRRSKKAERSPTPLFTVDISAGEVVGGLAPFLATDSVKTSPTPVVDLGSLKDGLLLPAHVMLASEESQSSSGDNGPLSPISDASGIDFVDDDRAGGAPRYFDHRAMNPKTFGPCRKCGDVDHDFKHCTAMICLTCGARDEHNSRSCPILRICYNCKGKGHIARNCPQIGGVDSREFNRDDCERCGSWKHHGTNCPTIWRIYTYLADPERDAILADRESKRNLGFGNGGEGYIARDAWCYNCGYSGHLGDDCTTIPANHDRPNDYSAFGSFNKLTGPFASTTSILPDINRAQRDWGADGDLDDGHGFLVQADVGRKGRENAKARAYKAQRLLDETDDEPNWFNKNQAASREDRKDRSELPAKPTAPTIRLGFRGYNSSRTPCDAAPMSIAPPASSRPSLRERIDTGDGWGRGDSQSSRYDVGTRHSVRNPQDTRNQEKHRHGGQRRSIDHELAWGENRCGKDEARTPERGSRWRGGYDR